MEKNIKLKNELLNHYRSKDPKLLLQYDGWANVEPGDPIVVPNENGNCYFTSETHELMTFGQDVRVLIKPGTDQEDAIELLEDIVELIKENGL